MNRDQRTTTNRADVWRNAAWYALIIAAMVLTIMKLLTGIVFMTALLFAVVTFMVAFAFIMRLTPRR